MKDTGEDIQTQVLWLGMLPKTELLKGIENLDQISRVLDRADQAIKTWGVVFTDFLSPQNWQKPKPS
jgi:RNA-binding protein YlmH